MDHQSGDRMAFRFFIPSLLLISMVCFLGCDQILNELNTLDYTISETFLTNETANSTGLDGIETVPIVNDLMVTKNGSPHPGVMMIPVYIPDYSALMALLEGGGCELAGTVENQKNNDVQFDIYFSGTGGLSDPEVEAFLIGQMELGSYETKAFQGYTEQMLTFFSNPENHNISIMYLYLTGSPEPLQVYVQSLSFILSPCFRISHIMQPSESYEPFMNRVQSIHDVQMCGSAKNDGKRTVTLSLTVLPTEGIGEWQGEVISIDLEPGETIQFEDLVSFPVEGGEDRMEQCLIYLIDTYQPIQCDLYIESTETIQVFIHSLIFKATIKVSI